MKALLGPRTAEELQALERLLAYEAACGAIEGDCEREEEANLDTWFDLKSAEALDDVADAVAYLDSRRLLLHHSQNPLWVMVLDEGEPLPEVVGGK